MKKQYLDYAGLKRVLKRLLPGARKIWHGTLEEWEALSEAERDKYDQAEVLDSGGFKFPKGYVYISMDDTNPRAIFGYGTWERVAKGKCLWGAAADGEAGTEKEAGLPNITGNSMPGRVSSGQNIAANGAFRQSLDGAKGLFVTDNDDSYVVGGKLQFNASLSNPIYGASTTVQPPALVLNMWVRTA